MNKCDKFNELISRVHNINLIYHSYHNLSNDELRNCCCEIETIINTSEDKEATLDLYLDKVFALVKETTRRFSEGDIVVTANKNDRLLAEGLNDFVTIEKDKAIYHHSWLAGGERITWNMIHYDEQMMGGILLHEGYATEMATGEGKTLVATLPVFLNALTHKGVHLMTCNDYLSKRDFELTRPIYCFHGLSVGCIEKTPQKGFLRKMAYESDITFGTNSSFAFDYLYDHLATMPNECVQGGHNFAVIDELDSILIDEADNPHIIGGGARYKVGDDFKKYKPLIEELLGFDAPPLYGKDIIAHKAWFTMEGERWLSEKTGIQDLFNYRRTYQNKSFDDMPADEKKLFINKLHIQNVLSQLLNAYTLYHRDEDYVVHNWHVVIIDPYTGRLKDTHRWEHGLHTAVEVKENLDPEDDFDGLAVISLKHYFKLYHKFSGMSGTITDVEEELKEVYGLNTFVLPTHNPVIRIDEPLRVYRSKEAKDNAIVEAIKYFHGQGRPVLVGCLSVKRCGDICRLLDQTSLVYNRLDAKSVENESRFVSLAGKENAITVATSIAGRGTDIKLSEIARDKGGLVVIGTDMFNSTRVERQLRGRSGRQGDPGLSLTFASYDDFVLNYLSEENHNTLSSMIHETESDEVTDSQIVGFFTKAQKNREEKNLAGRRELARKDDIIAPHRKRFYDERNAVLFDPNTTDQIINHIIDGNSKLAEKIENHIMTLRDKALKIFTNLRVNNRADRYETLPFSDERHLFSATFEIDQALNDSHYFAHEYKRHVILQTYDKFWKRFVLYILENLDDEELNHLNQKYLDLQNEINTIIINRLSHAKIPLNEPPEPAPTPEERVGGLKGGKFCIHPNMLCPCGSGKAYSECHGKKVKRRR